MTRRFVLSSFVALAIPFSSFAARQAGPSLVWGSTDVRYPQKGSVVAEKTPVLRAWKGERVFAQAVFTASEDCEISFSLTDLKCGNKVIPAECVKKSYVGYVLTDNYNNTDRAVHYVADRLDEVPSCKVKAGDNQPLWLDIKVPQGTAGGKYTGKIKLNTANLTLTLPISLTVGERTLPEPEDWKFHLDLWQNPYSVARYFGVPLWSKEHFDLMRPVMERYAKAGGKVITASIIQHPWQCQTHDPFESMIVKMKRIDGSWQYDYEVFDKWVEFMHSCGITRQIDCYTIVPWGYSFEYFDMGTSTLKTFSCKPQDKEYEEYLLPFLTDFAKHLKAKGWFEKTCIAMDERPADQLRIARSILHRADPGYRIQGATDYSPESVDIMYDISVAYKYVNLPAEVTAQRNRDGMVTTFYTCCGPERPNTFTFSPTAEATFLGLHAAALDFSGYLRWAFNSWTTDPCSNSLHDIRDWHGGDCYLVYPNGSSMRFDRLIQGIQDYEKIRILKENASESTLRKLEQILEPFTPNYFETLDAASLVKEAEAALIKLE